MNLNPTATKTVTVIGSTGLIGSQLVKHLSAAGHRIVEVSQGTRATSSPAKVSTKPSPAPMW